MSNVTPTKSYALQDVAIIRPIVIFLLVVMHSFAIYGNGGWVLPEGIQPVPSYSWMVKLISGFRIETIAFVAGYVFAYQSFVLGRKYQFGAFALKKFKRLIIPCLVFSAIYYFCYVFDRNTFGFGAFVLQLFSGVGHLWFLPMLFWCFILIWLIDRKQTLSWWLFFLLAALSMIPIPFNVLGCGRVFHFLFYCYAGYMMFAKREWIFVNLMKGKTIAWMWIAYFSLVILYYLFVETALGKLDAGLVPRLFDLLVSHGFKLIYSCIGVMALYLTVNLYIKRKDNYVLPAYVKQASSLCYGVYVFHQFILKWLYYYSPIPQLVGSFLLPWIGCAITLVISVLLASLFLKTKTGRFLIG